MSTKKTDQDLIAEGISAQFLLESDTPNYEDPEHKSFKRGLDLMNTLHALNKAHVDVNHTLGRIDSEIEQAKREREKALPELQRQISLGGTIAGERLKRHDDHLEHIHRLKAGVKAWKAPQST